MIPRIIPLCGISMCTALIMANLVSTASAQTLGEFALIIRLITDANVKNQGQCIQTLPQLISSAGIMEDLTEQQIKEFAKLFCKERY
jgi:hypothetical protein